MRRKSKKKILITVISILLILFGIPTALYPTFSTYISSKESNDMLEVLDQAIEENKKNKTSEKTINTEKPIKTPDPYKGLSKNVQKLLKNQKLIGIISIDKLNIRFPISEGTLRSNIRASIGHMIESSDIGEKKGNCVLAGHRGGIYGEFFKYINKLKKGDKIHVITLDGIQYTYEEYEQVIIEPSDKDAALKLVPNQTTLTLLSCNDNGKRRILVRCVLKETKMPNGIILID